MITDKDPTYLLDQLRQAVLLIDSKGRLTYCNEAASLLWHRDASRLQGMEADLLFQHDAQIREKLKLVLDCLLYTSPSPRDGCRSRMPSSA